MGSTLPPFLSDNYIQKTKQKYNNTRQLYTRIDLSQISTELKNNPPFEVPESDLGGSSAGGSSMVSNGGSLLSAPPSTTNGKLQLRFLSSFFSANLEIKRVLETGL